MCAREKGRGSEREARLSAAVSNIRVDAATAEVVRAFDAALIECVLLKGRALADWYGRNVPIYNDSDLWVAPGDVEHARAVLSELGFRPGMDRRHMPDWWEEHADDWRREQDGAVVDLHHRLQGIGVDASEGWSVLSGHVEPVDVAGHTVRRLSTPARALYVTLHAGHHGRIWNKALCHLQVALEVVPLSAWREASELASRLDAVDEFSAGLYLTPEGAAHAAELGVPQAESASVRLQASSPPPVARGLQQLAAAGWLNRVEIVIRKFVPPAEFVRRWWPPAARGRAWLVLGYFYRPIWLVWHAPAGWRAWRSARERPR